MDNNMIFSLDIGSSKIVAMVGSIGDEVEVHGISTHYFVNNGQKNEFLSMSHGSICNVDMIAHQVLQILNEAKINADCSTGSVFINIGGNGIFNHYFFNQLELKNQVVSWDMMTKLIDISAYSEKIPLKYKVIDHEIQEYLLDGEQSVVHPIHLRANTIQSKVNLFLCPTNHLENIKNIMPDSSYELAKTIPSSILSAMAVLNVDEKQLGCCLIDIGSGTTDIVVYEAGYIRCVYSIPMGGENITGDITSVLKITRNLAEDIKLSYGSATYISNHIKSPNNSVEGISITDHRGVQISISRKLLVDVIRERLKDIFEITKSTLIQNKQYDIINSGIVITGGSSLLPHLEDFAKNYFDMPVRIGIPHYTGDYHDLISVPKYATCLGGLYLAQAYLQHHQEQLKYKSRGVLYKIKKYFSGKPLLNKL